MHFGFVPFKSKYVEFIRKISFWQLVRLAVERMPIFVSVVERSVNDIWFMT
jgi:hypothetical protein